MCFPHFWFFFYLDTFPSDNWYYLIYSLYITLYTLSLEGLSDAKTLVPEVKKDDMTEAEKKQGFRIRNLKHIDEETSPDDLVSREYKGTPLDRNQKQEL